MNRSDYVEFISPIHGAGAGQVIDIIEKVNRTVLLVEPLYNERDRRRRRLEDRLITLELKDATVIEHTELNKRMRYR